MKYNFDYTKYLDSLVLLFLELEKRNKVSAKDLARLVKRYPKENGNVFSKDELLLAYRNLAGTHGLKAKQKHILNAVKMKPTRTQSGVTPITILTKPFPCPGNCIFCPSDVKMPKSYLSSEPGAQRAERNWFDPYLQTYNRLQALRNIGHSVSKAEIIILGGTWSSYPESYQVWFIKEIFRALNEFGKKDNCQKIEKKYLLIEKILEEKGEKFLSNNPEKNQVMMKDYLIRGTAVAKKEQLYNQVVKQVYETPERQAGVDKYQTATWLELEKQQQLNEQALVRSVGLVIETRPDKISETEVKRIRRLGCTKVQVGVQSLSDEVLRKNKRGHLVAETVKAFELLRLAGFKIHVHWMANLYGSNVKADKQDYQKLFADLRFRPDELKIYPCSLLESAELMKYYNNGLWKPYSYEELAEVLEFVLLNTPAYCRLTRVIRDIPATEIVEGNKLSNFRQIAEQRLAKAGLMSIDIRAREIRKSKFDPNDLVLKRIEYQTTVSKEFFLEFVVSVATKEKIVAFLRLSLPTKEAYIKELRHTAIIREVHVYGGVVDVGTKQSEKPQHLGLGTRLLKEAQRIAKDNRYQKLAVISAIGTKEYYRKKGFVDGQLYQFKKL